jgi:hypothetical protein
MITDIANFEAEIEDGHVLVTRTGELSSTADLVTPTIKKSFIEKAAWLYEDAANRFLELLLMTILVTGESAPIGDDLRNARIRDEVGFDRDLTIVNWMVIICRTAEHLKLSCDVYADAYLAKPGFKDNTYLFAQGSERCSKERYENILKRETTKRMGFEMNMEGYEAFHRVWMMDA